MGFVLDRTSPHDGSVSRSHQVLIGTRRRGPASLGARFKDAVRVLVLALSLSALYPAVPAQADEVRDEQRHLISLHASEAWQEATGEGVVVAVVDSGVDADHVDLVGQVLPGIDLVDETPDGALPGGTDAVGHGTTVAALIAGRGDDEDGVIGLAYNAKILPVRVLDENNRYDDARVVAEGIRWAVDHGADVINLSLGGTRHSTDLAAAIQYAFDHDVVVVACAGNLDEETSTVPNEPWYPAREPGVVAVSGLDRNNRLWSGSLYGPEISLAAPATDVLGARPGGYWRVQGTSFGAPLVSATAALIRSRWPSLSADEVVNRLLQTATDLGPAGRDDQYGYGLVNPVAALTAEVPPLSETSPTSSAATAPAASPSQPDALTARRVDNSFWLLYPLGLGGIGIAVLVIALVLHYTTPRSRLQGSGMRRNPTRGPDTPPSPNPPSGTSPTKPTPPPV